MPKQLQGCGSQARAMRLAVVAMTVVVATSSTVAPAGAQGTRPPATMDPARPGSPLAGPVEPGPSAGPPWSASPWPAPSDPSLPNYAHLPGALGEPPDRLGYEPGDPIPPGYELRTGVRRGLVISGIVVLGSMWFFSAVAGAFMVDCESCTTTSSEAAVMFIPVVGPALALATVDPYADAGTLLVLDALGQAGGLTLLIAGLAGKETYLRRTEPDDWSIVPLAGRRMAGVGLSGGF